MAKADRIFLNKNFYRIEAVQEAKGAFKEICDVDIIDNSILIEIEQKQDIKNLKQEFCNYVLGVMKNNSMV